MLNVVQKLFQNKAMMVPMEALLNPVYLDMMQKYGSGYTVLGLANEFNMKEEDMDALLSLSAEFVLNFYEQMLLNKIPTKRMVPLHNGALIAERMTAAMLRDCE